MWVVFRRETAVTKRLGVVQGVGRFNDRLREVVFWE